MGDVSLVALLVAVLGTGGVTAVVTSIIAAIRAARAGVATREDARTKDIVSARDEAIRDASLAERHYDDERQRRRIMEDELTIARRRLMELGHDPRPWPEIEGETGPRA
jgi:hypothetical protein